MRIPELPRLSDALAPGQRVWTSTLCSEPLLLQDELRRDPARADGVTFTGVQFPGIDSIDYLALHPGARAEGFFMSPGLRQGIREGRATLLPMEYGTLARHLESSEPVDLAIAQLSLPDANGWCSLGLTSDFLPIVWPRARRRIAHLNPRMPRTPGSFRVHVSELDGAVLAEHAITQYATGTPGEVEARIAASVAALVRDGDTVQVGIGDVPLAAGEGLRGHRRLRLRTGMLTPAFRTLWDAGALEEDAQIITGAILGDTEFQAFAASRPNLWMTDVRTTHDPCASGAIPRYVAINGAVEVDLFGQVNAERAQGALLAGAGGLPAFAAAALRSPGGRFLTCLPAATRSGAISRIVPAIESSGLVTLPRTSCDVVVTEHGRAEVRNLSMDARAQALIAIAAPAHRDALSNAWDAMRARM
ncbi:acetyl-CoA hydrolase [Ramlibacter sp. G-1-2-2]|uniref:Acetyl-CoA hydrolase n=1 Tax=Ramlibacter agri TaxID=2728837 RepID=A0A848H152_9BURK|nr:acetyl-CoA hydrolase/transferase C-terminal domain-containing protein [Ramlibacter agri]NML43331.1 acetyl-CoA hydrolase [Ramlibacter agri]